MRFVITREYNTLMPNHLSFGWRIGYEKIEETEDHGKAIQHALATYLKRGYFKEWVGVLKEYTKRSSVYVESFRTLKGRETCFDWEEPLLNSLHFGRDTDQSAPEARAIKVRGFIFFEFNNAAG